MPYMPFVARPAPIHRHALCLELRILIKIFPSIILRLISLLSLPWMLLACIVFRVRLKRWHLVEVFVSFVAHVLFLYCLKIHQNPVSAAGISRHTIACTICQKSTSRIYFPLFRFLAPLSSGQKRSHLKTPVFASFHIPLFSRPSNVAGRDDWCSRLRPEQSSDVSERHPVLADVPPDIFSSEYPPFRMALIALIQPRFTCG